MFVVFVAVIDVDEEEKERTSSFFVTVSSDFSANTPPVRQADKQRMLRSTNAANKEKKGRNVGKM